MEIMQWFIFALLGAFFSATYYMLNKKLLKDINQHVLASGVFLSGFVIMFIISLAAGIPSIGSRFYFAVFASALINVIAAILYLKALKTTDLSLAIPMISFTPVFMIVTSFFILGELPTPIGMVGIFFVVIGAYVLHSKAGPGHIAEPFREMFRKKGIVYMLIVSLLFSFAGNFDKMAILDSSPVFAASILFLVIGVTFLGIALAKRLDVRTAYRNNLHKFLLVGIVISLVAITMNTAFKMQIVPYAVSLKRVSILFSVVYGGVLFKEKDILRRGIAALIMVAGVVLIILF